MPTSVTLVLELDNKGAIRGVEEVSSEFKNLGSTASSGAGKAAEGFKKMEASEKKAHDTLQLISGTIGVQIPRDVEKVISKMPGLSTALSAGFKVGAVLGVAAAVAQIADNFDLLQKKATDVGLKFQALFNKDIRETLDTIGTNKALEPVVDQLNNLKHAAEIAGKEGLGLTKAQLAVNLAQLDEFKSKYLKSKQEMYLTDGDQYQDIERQTNGFVRQAKLLAEKASNEDVALARKQALRTAAQDRLQAEAAAARGELQIDLELSARKKQIALDEKIKGVRLKDEVIAAETQRARAIEDLRRSASDDIFTSEQKASVETAASWEKANAQIVADSEARKREITRQLRDTVINSQEADRLREANWKETNARMAQQYSTDFESLYNDITSGNIGKRIKTQMNKFFFDLAGQWYSAIVGSRQRSSSTLGFIGSLLGIGGLGAATPQYGQSRVIFNGQPISQLNDFGAPNVAASLFGLGGQGSVGGFGSSSALASTGGFGAGLSDFLGGRGSLNTPSVSDSVSSSSVSSGTGLGRLASGASSIFSAAGISKLLPSVLGLGGSAFGGTIGAGFSVLGIGSLLAKSGGQFLSGIAPLAAPLAAGLFGFGVGQAHGPVAGALTGAGSGLALGLAAPLLFGATLAPATFGLSIIIGALAGLFGGLFGGSKRRRQAEQLAQQTLAQITQINAQYKGFQIDYASAITGLESIRTQGYPQFDQLKGEGRSVWQSSVLPKITSAESEINAINVERARRSSLLFGPPQFATGGQFLAPGSGKGIAILDHEEVVMGKDAVRAYGAKNLLAMNEAARSGNASSVGGGDNVTIYAVDAQSFEGMLKRHGWQTIKRMSRRDRLEGKPA